MIVNILILILSTALALSAFLMDSGDLYVLFGMQLFLVLVNLVWQRYIFYIFSPLILLILYIDISMFVGGWAFSSGYIQHEFFLSRYSEWKNMDTVTSIFIMMNAIIYYIDSKYRLTHQLFICSSKKVKKVTWLYVLFGFFVAVIFFFLFVDFSLFGASNSPNQIFLITGFFIITVFLVSRKNRIPVFIRVVMYLIMLYLLMSISIYSKRDAIFAILPVIFLECYVQRYQYNIRSMLSMLLIILFVLTSIIYMSIVRGYGGGGVEIGGVFANAALISEYLRSEVFLKHFMVNMEFSHFYFNGYNSIETILSNPSLLAFGSTIIKPLFIFIPRDLASFKPDSMINTYTREVHPVYSETGESWPINILSEFFWNFHFFSFIFIAIYAIVVIRLYYKYLHIFNHASGGMIAFGMVVYMSHIMLIRGSGFDLFTIYCIFSLFTIISINFIKKKQMRKLYMFRD